MSFLRDLYFFQGQKYTSFGQNIFLRQSTSLGHSSTGHPVMIQVMIQKMSDYLHGQYGALQISSPALGTWLQELHCSEGAVHRACSRKCLLVVYWPTLNEYKY